MKVFISCSAREGVDVKYKNIASELATFLAKRGHKLVFGGYDTGMMGKLFYTYKYENGKVKGINDLNGADILNMLECDAKEVTPNSFERTKKLYQSSDMTIILPGGIGTFAEFFSILDEVRSRIDNYPLILFNYDNYFTPLLDFLAKSHELNLTSDTDLKSFDIVTNLDSLKNYIIKHEKEEDDR